MSDEPPPGTVEKGFWERGATRAAIGTTYFVSLGFLVRWVTEHFGLGLAVSVDVVASAWGLAFGLSRVDEGSLRAK